MGVATRRVRQRCDVDVRKDAAYKSTSITRSPSLPCFFSSRLLLSLLLYVVVFVCSVYTEPPPSPPLPLRHTHFLDAFNRNDFLITVSGL